MLLLSENLVPFHELNRLLGPRPFGAICKSYALFVIQVLRVTFLTQLYGLRSWWWP